MATVIFLFYIRTTPHTYRTYKTKEVFYMLIMNNEQITKKSGVFSYIPRGISRYLDFVDEGRLEEIRLRCGLPVSLCYDSAIRYVDKYGTLTDNIHSAVKVTREHINEGMELITSSSLYALENRIQSGFITLKGGHRVGICGQCVIKGGQISFIENISGLNYRLARQIMGAADGVIDSIINGRTIRSTLIIAPPNMGKTTLLRDAVRQISARGFKVSVVDERSEISGLYDGTIMYDLGPNTDVLDNSPKAEGIMMMLRSMSPDVIATDEIGGAGDMEAIVAAAVRGVSVIATVHAADIAEVRRNPEINLALFECIITLGKRGSVREAVVI